MRPPLSTISASLAAASLVAITQILTTTPDHFLLIAIWIFAFCLPFLVVVAVDPPVTRRAPFAELTQEEVRALAWFLILALMDVVGFVCVFFHFGVIAGILFLLACFLAFGFVTRTKIQMRLAMYLLLLPAALIHTGVVKSYKFAARFWRKRS